jgi:hypothetical protein
MIITPKQACQLLRTGSARSGRYTMTRKVSDWRAIRKLIRHQDEEIDRILRLARITTRQMEANGRTLAAEAGAIDNPLRQTEEARRKRK